MRIIDGLSSSDLGKLLTLLATGPARIPQRHLLEWSDPTGDTAAQNVDRSREKVADVA